MHRPRLLEKLDKHPIQPFTLVAAPAGYGKSMSVSCWVNESGLPAAWLSLDESDNNLRLFLKYLVAAVQSVSAETGADLQNVLNSQTLPSASTLAGYLLNELDGIDQTTFLVIDDFHVINNSEIFELLDEILKHPPHELRLVLLSRTDPPLSLASLRAHGQMNEVRTRDLQFRQDEAWEFLQRMLGSEVDKELAAVLRDKTEGWITGLHLAALSMHHSEGPDPTASKLPDNNRYIVDYFVAEILQRQPQAIQDCLLKTSILNRFCAPLCETLCGASESPAGIKPDGQQFIQHLIDGKLFMIPLDRENHWFRFHHLFQDLLVRKLEKRFGVREIAKLHIEASAWFSSQGFVEEALHHAIESGDRAVAASLISRHRHEIMSSEQWHRLEYWLSLLPEGQFESTPEIIVLRAWLCETWLRVDDLRKFLHRAGEYFKHEPQDPSADWICLRAEYFALRALLHYIDGDSDQAIEFSRLALAGLSPEAQHPRAIAQCMLSFGYQVKGDLNQAHQVLYTAIKESGHDGTSYQSKLLLALALLHWMEGDLEKMDLAAVRILELGQKAELPESVGIAHYMQGICHYLKNNLDDAESSLSTVVQNFYEPNLLNYAHSAFAMALSLEARGKSEEARNVVEKTIKKAMEARSREFQQLAEAFQADLFLRQGQIAGAKIWADRYDPLPLDPGYRSYIPQLTLAKVLLADNSPGSIQKATELLSDLHAHYTAINNTRFVIDVLALQALLLESQGNHSHALKRLGEALALAEPAEFIRPFLDLGPAMVGLLKAFAADESDRDYVRRILNAAPPATDHQLAASGANSHGVAPEPLTNREIQILKVLSQGHSNQQIADALFISPETVKRHLYNVFQKFGVKNRQQAIDRARSLGID